MKKYILPVVLLVFLFNYSPAFAQESRRIKADCTEISSILHFQDKKDDSGFYGCVARGDDTAVGNTDVGLSGEIWTTRLPEDISGPDRSYLSNVPPAKTEDLQIANKGKIFYWGPPWGEGARPEIEYRAVIGSCEMVLSGAAFVNIKYIFDESRKGPFKPDFDKASEYMTEKLSAAAKEIEAAIAADCGAGNVIDVPKMSGKESVSNSLKPKLPVFIGEWFKAVSGGIILQDWFADTMSILMTGQAPGEKAETEKSLNYIGSLTDDYVYALTGYTKSDLEDLADRDPALTKDIIGSLKKTTQDSPYSLDILNGQAQIKYPGQNNWSELREGDKIPSGSTIFTGMDTTTVLTISGKGVVQVQSFTEIKISETGLEEAAKTGQTFTDIDLQKGEIEINIEKGIFTGFDYDPLNVSAPYTTIGVRGTHFWVKHDEDKQIDIVGVYEGKVAVKSAGGKIAEITPNGDKPGIIVVSQKLSTTKLAAAGLVLASIVGGTVLLLKKRGTKTPTSKKKTSR